MSWNHQPDYGLSDVFFYKDTWRRGWDYECFVFFNGILTTRSWDIGPQNHGYNIHWNPQFHPQLSIV